MLTTAYLLTSVGCTLCALAAIGLAISMWIRIRELRKRLVELVGGEKGWRSGEMGFELNRQSQLMRCAYIIAFGDALAQRQKLRELKRHIAQLDEELDQ